MDRGEDDDWFGSQLHRHHAVISAAAASSARSAGCCWREKPVVNLHGVRRPQLRGRLHDDRGDGLGVLYSSAVVIPQLAQTVLGYTATWAGLHPVAGRAVLLLDHPVIVQRLMLPYVQTRFLIADRVPRARLARWSIRHG